MRKRLIGVSLILITVTVVPRIVAAQTAESSAKERSKDEVSSPDISGVWMGRELSKTFKGDLYPLSNHRQTLPTKPRKPKTTTITPQRIRILAVILRGFPGFYSSLFHSRLFRPPVRS